MNIGRKIIKHRLIKQHRQVWYERELDRLIAGESKPGNVTLRWNKRQEVYSK